jgi:hypothetical protein
MLAGVALSKPCGRGGLDVVGDLPPVWRSAGSSATAPTHHGSAIEQAPQDAGVVSVLAAVEAGMRITPRRGTRGARAAR